MTDKSAIAVHCDHYESSPLRKKFVYTWTINNFNSWFPQAEGLQTSSTFPAGREDIQWNLGFTPSAKDDPAYCSLVLNLVTCGIGRHIDTQCEVTLRNSKKHLLAVKFSRTVQLPAAGYWGWNKLFRTEDLLKETAPDDKLIIICKINAIVGIVNGTSNHPEHPAATKFIGTLQKDLMALVDDEAFGDITLLVNGNRFHAYKGILAARSSVFSAMFRTNMREKIEKSVIITDVEPSVFAELLRFIYTDTVANLSAVAHKLFVVSDKYAIPSLRTLCRTAILEGLSVDNAAETLRLADTYNDGDMKAKVMEFLRSDAAAGVAKTAAWKELARSHPQLLMDAFEAVTAEEPTPKKVKF